MKGLFYCQISPACVCGITADEAKNLMLKDRHIVDAQQRL